MTHVYHGQRMWPIGFLDESYRSLRHDNLNDVHPPNRNLGGIPETLS